MMLIYVDGINIQYCCSFFLFSGAWRYGPMKLYLFLLFRVMRSPFVGFFQGIGLRGGWCQVWLECSVSMTFRLSIMGHQLSHENGGKSTPVGRLVDFCWSINCFLVTQESSQKRLRTPALGSIFWVSRDWDRVSFPNWCLHCFAIAIQNQIHFEGLTVYYLVHGYYGCAMFTFHWRWKSSL